MTVQWSPAIFSCHLCIFYFDVTVHTWCIWFGARKGIQTVKQIAQPLQWVATLVRVKAPSWGNSCTRVEPGHRTLHVVVVVVVDAFAGPPDLGFSPVASSTAWAGSTDGLLMSPPMVVTPLHSRLPSTLPVNSDNSTALMQGLLLICSEVSFGYTVTLTLQLNENIEELLNILTLCCLVLLELFQPFNRTMQLECILTGLFLCFHLFAVSP